MAAYYSEHDPFAAAWLRNLIAKGHIAPGDVDERDIRDIKPDDLRDYIQCHFYAGIGTWSAALRGAGFPDDRKVWTLSCPCQPFSAAGKGGGFDDERHLWPASFHLIEECRPELLFGEQVASKDGLAWLDLVQADLEGAGYTFGVQDLCGAGFGAPHIRQRLYFVGERLDDTPGARRYGPIFGAEGETWDDARVRVSGTGRSPSLMGDDDDEGLEGRGQSECERPDKCAPRPSGLVGELADPTQQQQHGSGDGRPRRRDEHSIDGATSRVADTDGGDASAEGLQRSGEHGQRPEDASSSRMEHPGGGGWEWREAPAPGHDDDGQTSERSQSEHGAGIASAHRIQQHGPGPLNGFWRDADWLRCRDGRWRPVEPGSFALAHGITGRVGRLRAYGNAIIKPVAEEWIGAYLEYELADRAIDVGSGGLTD